MKISILSETYTVLFKQYKDEPLFEKRGIDGYCDDTAKRIVICKMKTHPAFINASDEYCNKVEKEVLRHEFIHAFLSESGLSASSLQYSGGWAKNEEMVDFFAIQFPKIVKVFEKFDCLE